MRVLRLRDPLATLPLAEGKKGCLTLRMVMRKEGNGMCSS